MPEYLSPGVFIEEVPARLKAIEGVSTSTVGLVGPAERGTVPGYPLPYDAEAGPGGATLVLPRDPAPLLVTSYGDFVRQFGGPLPLPDPNGHAYLERAVRAFYDNGGKRCYVSRAVHFDDGNLGQSATRTFLTLNQGPIVHLARRARAGDPGVFVHSLRGLSDADSLDFVRRADGSVVETVAVASYDTAANRLDLGAPLTNDLDPGDVYAVANTLGVNGPRFWARNPGSWSGGLTINISPSDKGPVEITAAAAATDTQLQVAATGSFYRGAILEIDTGTERLYNEVLEILPGNVLGLANAIGGAGITLTTPPAAFARVVEVDVSIADDTAAQPVTEVFRGLTWNPRNEPAIRRRYYAAVVNARSRLVYVQPPGFDSLAGTEDATLATQPTTTNGFPVSAPVIAAADPTRATVGLDNYAQILDDDYVGEDQGPGTRTGIQALADIDDISIVAAPGRTAVQVQNALITHCENLRYRFAVLDGERDPAGGTVNAILAHRNAYDSAYAAYYQPWLEVIENGDRHFLPPSGFVAGIYARTDVDRGVHKAPANEVVRSIVGLRSYITTGEQDILNPRGVNAIRQFSGRGIRVWGARTLSSDPEFRYVPVRRFLIFLEKSIDRGTGWVVFEPNHPDTWSRVTDSVSAFLHTQWRSGALFGRTPEEAFFVRCDESTMTTDDIENGRLICNIGVAITKPAEFVIFRIEQLAAFAEAA